MLGTNKKIISVLRGGISPAHSLSLKNGRKAKNVLGTIYTVNDVMIDKNGNWYLNGFQVQPQIVLQNSDFVWNALLGTYGEDGQVQRLLESFGKKYNGTKPVGSAVSMNKRLSKKIFSDSGIKVPIWKTIKISMERIKQIAFDLFKSFAMPAVIKPISSGSSHSVYYCDSYNSLVDALEKMSQAGEEEILIEEFINGKEVSLGVIRGFRDRPLYSTLPIEICKKNPIYDFETKELGDMNFIIPAGLTSSEKEMAEKISFSAHQALGLGHYSKADLIIHPRRGVYVLEINSLPDIWENSSFYKSMAPLSISPEEFYEYIISLAENTR